MKVAFLANALDSSAALYNVMSHLATSFKELECDVRLRSDVGILNSALCPYKVLVYDSAWGAANTVAQLRNRHKFKHVVFHHIHESAAQLERKRQYLKYVNPSLVLVTFDEMADVVHGWGFNCEVVPFSFDIARFKHLDYPATFTVGYMGADMTHKGFDVVDEVARELGIPCVGARRVSHEGGEWAGREMDFYSQISCYVAMPTHESGPLPPIEAQLCGRPCVMTPVGMMPYMFKHGAGGLLVNKHGLHDAVCDVRDDFERHAERARAFTLPDTSAQYEAAIKGVL